jgi:amphi-Trp domain-containing protein
MRGRTGDHAWVEWTVDMTHGGTLMRVEKRGDEPSAFRGALGNDVDRRVLRCRDLFLRQSWDESRRARASIGRSAKRGQARWWCCPVGGQKSTLRLASAKLLASGAAPGGRRTGNRVETEDVMSEELFEVEEEQVLSREAAAARLRQLADQLARHNQIEFMREGTRYSVTVPDEVKLKVEIEIGEENEIEFELTW